MNLLKRQEAVLFVTLVLFIDNWSFLLEVLEAEPILAVADAWSRQSIPAEINTNAAQEMPIAKARLWETVRQTDAQHCWPIARFCPTRVNRSSHHDENEPVDSSKQEQPNAAPQHAARNNRPNGLIL